MRPRSKTVVTGGAARAQSYELVGPLADGVLGRITLVTDPAADVRTVRRFEGAGIGVLAV